MLQIKIYKITLRNWISDTGDQCLNDHRFQNQTVDSAFPKTTQEHAPICW